jgi:hypothetical protein
MDDQFTHIPFQTGVVEDIQDPEELGRVKVRVYGFHAESRQDLPTVDLPWSFCILPITSASMSSIGRSPTGLLKGSTVVGFFRDGINAQDFIVMGSLSSISTVRDPSKGFSDEEDIYPKKALLDKPDNPIPARSKDEVYKESRVYKSKEGQEIKKIETASAPSLGVGSIKGGEGKSWSNLVTDDVVKPKFPANHVEETESGHVIERDDTEGFERLSEFHTSGTYEEVVASGDKTTYIVGDNYEVVLKGKNILIRGDLNLTVEGDMRTLVKGNRITEVEGDDALYVKGSRGTKIGGNDLVEIDLSRTTNIAEDENVTIGNNEVRVVTKDQDISIMGNKDELISKDNTQTILENNNQIITGTSSIGVTKNLTMVSSKNMQIQVAEQMKIEAVSDVLMKASGDMELSAAKIDLNP